MSHYLCVATLFNLSLFFLKLLLVLSDHLDTKETKETDKINGQFVNKD